MGGSLREHAAPARDSIPRGNLRSARVSRPAGGGGRRGRAGWRYDPVAGRLEGERRVGLHEQLIVVADLVVSGHGAESLGQQHVVAAEQLRIRTLLLEDVIVQSVVQ